METGILYSFRRCPFAIRARWAILDSKLSVTLREVDLKNKPKELLEISPKGTVPVLLTDKGNIVDQSLEIIEWAQNNSLNKNKYKNYDSLLKTKVDNLIKENDNIFKYHLDRYKYSDRHHEMVRENEYKEAKQILLSWNNSLKESNNNELKWLLTDHESIADIAIWPFVRQFRMVNPNKFDQEDELYELKKWLDYYTNHNLFNVLMKKYQPWEANQSATYFPFVKGKNHYV